MVSSFLSLVLMSVLSWLETATALNTNINNSANYSRLTEIQAEGRSEYSRLADISKTILSVC